MFAIQAGVRLHSAVRAADADAKRSAALNLPLPLAEAPQYAAARAWFKTDDGRKFIVVDARLRDLVEALVNPPQPDQDWVVAQYRVCRPLPAVVNVDEAVGLFAVEQWTSDDPNAPPSGLRTVAGEVVNLAVDYFAHTPGAVSSKRPEGKALMAVLEALDDDDFKTADFRDVAGQIVLATVGAVSQNPGLFGGGARQTLLVQSVATALAKTVKERLDKDVPNSERLQASEWLRLVGAAVLEGGIEAVAANPKTFLGSDDDPKKTVAFDVTRTVADLLVGDDKMVTFRDVLSGDGLRTVLRSTVAAVAANPDVLGPDRRGLRTILLSVATDVAKDGLPKDLAPEIARLVLAKTAANLELVWPDAKKDDASKHLLLTAARSVLTQLAAPGGKMKFGKEDVIGLVEIVLDEIVENPEPFVGAAAAKSADLGAAVGAVLKALAAAPAGRVNGAAAAAAVEAALLAVASNHDLLEPLPAGSADAGKTALEAAVGAVVAELFKNQAKAQAKWALARSSVVVGMTQAALAALAKRGVTAQRVEALRKFVAGWVGDARPFDAAAFADELAQALA
jgi:hypothetical protein